MSKSIIIYGFGRMGLTHYAILNQLIDQPNITLVDLDKKVNFFAKKNVKARLISKEKDLNSPFDIAVVCTPPMFHVSTVETCLERGDKAIFVEKPFGGIDEDYSKLEEYSHLIKIGYVMRFLPVIKWMKNNIASNRIVKFEGSYFSNTIEKKPKGWRNGKFSGVTNEMGSHIIDLAVALTGIKEFEVTNKNVKSVVSDVDDIVSFSMKSNNTDYQFNFDWVNSNYRKPVFTLKLTLDNGDYYIIDQQKIEAFSKDHFLTNKITNVDLAETVAYYLRGVEFTHQMDDLIKGKKKLASMDEALITRKIIKTVLN